MFIAMGPLTRSGQIETGESLARPRHPGDEADDLSPLALCNVDGLGDIASGAGQVLGTCLGTRDLLNVVTAIESLGRLNNGWCRVVATGKPLRRINRGCSPDPAGVVDCRR